MSGGAAGAQSQAGRAANGDAAGAAASSQAGSGIAGTPSSSRVDAGSAGTRTGAGAQATSASAAGSGASGGGAQSSDAGGAAAIGSMSGAASTTVLRVSELYLRDPHIFVDGFDLTDVPLLGLSVNGWLIPSRLGLDENKDGFVDVSILALLPSLDPSMPTTSLTLLDGNCTKDMVKPCVGARKGLNANWMIENRTQGNCLEPAANTTSNYSPAIRVPAAPCFTTQTGANLQMNLGGIMIEFTATRISATYRGNPTDQLVDGIIVGFVTTAVATHALLPADLGPYAGTPLNDYIRKEDRDLSTSPNGQDGFWMYLNFVAKPVQYTP
jgi:hypothetical protein